MEIKRTALAEAVQKCLPGVETGTALIEGTDTLVFTSGAISAFNDSIHVSVVLQDSEIVGCVKAKEFSKLISKLAGETVTIEMVDGKWVLICGNTEAELALFSDNITKHVASLGLSDVDWKPLPEDFQQALKLTKISGNTNPVRGAFVHGNHLYSTDSIRINEYTFRQDMLPFWIDDPAVAELLKIGTLVEYGVSGSWAHFRTKEGAVFSAKQKDYSLFPIKGIQAHLQKALESPILAANNLPVVLADAVGRVAVFGSEGQGVVSVHLSMKKDHVIVFSGRATGKAKEKVAWVQPFETDPGVECVVDYTFLQEAASKVAQFELREVDGSKILRFFSEHYNQLAVTVEA